MTNSINCVNFQGKEACSNSKAEAARRSSTLLAVEKRWSSKGRAVRTGRASVGNGQTLRILPLVHAREELTGMAFAPLLTHACVWRICTGGPCSARAARTSVKSGQMSVFCCVRVCVDHDWRCYLFGELVCLLLWHTQCCVVLPRDWCIISII